MLWGLSKTPMERSFVPIRNESNLCAIKPYKGPNIFHQRTNIGSYWGNGKGRFGVILYMYSNSVVRVVSLWTKQYEK